MKETISIGRINGSDITAIKTEDGTVLVPIKPICTALGIEVESQRQKITEDEDLNPTALLSKAVGADGKEREMFCIPEEFVYGWLFTINPKNVATSARESVRKYRRQCYTSLYHYFHGRAQRQQEAIDIERSLVEQKDQLREKMADISKAMADMKAQIKDIDGKIAELQSERLNPTPSIFD